MTETNVIPATEAAKEKGCTVQAIYNAIERGDLTGRRMGSHRMVVLDEKYESYEVQETGGRLHKRYRQKGEENGN